MEDKSNEMQYCQDILAGMAERTVRRWFIAWIITFILFILTNAYWMYERLQYEVVETTTITQENEDGYNNYIGDDGSIINGGLYGEGETDYCEDSPDEEEDRR